MRAGIRRPGDAIEFETSERCFILESVGQADGPDLSIARARVEPGVTTALHVLTVDERYLVVTGTGSMELVGKPAGLIGPGDVVVIPRGTPQRVRNTGTDDLVFYCVCTPGFTPECYSEIDAP